MKPLPEYDLTDCEGTQAKLKLLRDTHGLTWSQIAKIPLFKNIPLATLSMIYHGKRAVPKIYRTQLGEPETVTVPVCPKHGVAHCYDCQTQTVRRKAKLKKQPDRLPRYTGWLWDVGRREILRMLKDRKQMKPLD